MSKPTVTDLPDGSTFERDAVEAREQVSGCELMKCTDYIDGVCHHDGECKYRAADQGAEVGRLNSLVDKAQRHALDFSRKCEQVILDNGTIIKERDGALAEVESLREELNEKHDWQCGCGHWNGSNLYKCACCSRNPNGEMI